AAAGADATCRAAGKRCECRSGNPGADGRVPRAARAAWMGGGARPCRAGIPAGARRRGHRMKRREVITLLGGAAAWPLVARAQQPTPVRRIGVLSTLPADDSEGTARTAAFLQTLQELGWTDGRNVRIDIRWGAGDAERISKYVAELLALKPDVILATGASSVGPLQRATRTVPIVFAQVTDPVGAGLVESLARPGGNATGF